MHDPQTAQSPVARSLAPRVAGSVTRAQVGGRVELTVDARSLNELVAAGQASELDYLGDGAATARDLELVLMTTADWIAAEPEIAAADLRDGLASRIAAAAGAID